MHFRPATNFLSDTVWDQVGLAGVNPEMIYQVMSFPYRGFLRDGTAPMGPNERDILRLL